MSVMNPIGTIYSCYKDRSKMPIQPVGGEEQTATVEVFPEFTAGLNDLDGFSHIYLIYLFHQSQGYDLNLVPFMDDKAHGVFATRAPRRPNPIGLSIVRIISIKDNRIKIAGVDVLDQTPLLDIKPYIEKFDRVESSRSGWMVANAQQVKQKRSDQRFIID